MQLSCKRDDLCSAREQIKLIHIDDLQKQKRCSIDHDREQNRDDHSDRIAVQERADAEIDKEDKDTHDHGAYRRQDKGLHLFLFITKILLQRSRIQKADRKGEDHVTDYDCKDIDS